jgi:hypothetical protein
MGADVLAQGAGGIGAEVLAQGAGGMGAEVLAFRPTPLVTTNNANAVTADHLLIDPPKGNNGRSL